MTANYILKHIQQYCVGLFLFRITLEYTYGESLCPDGWSYMNLRCYNVQVYKDTDFDRSWSSARDHCGQDGGDLVSYNSALEQYIIQKQLKEGGIEDKNLYWIGLHDNNNDGAYSWVDHTSVTYTNWYSGSRPEWLPEQKASSDDRHQVLASGDGQWYDVTNHWSAKIGECNEPSGFVCEKRANLDLYSTILKPKSRSTPKTEPSLAGHEKYRFVLGPYGMHLPRSYMRTTTLPTILDESANIFNTAPHNDLAFNMYKRKVIRHLYNKWGGVHTKSGSDDVTEGTKATTVGFDLLRKITTGPPPDYMESTANPSVDMRNNNIKGARSDALEVTSTPQAFAIAETTMLSTSAPVTSTTPPPETTSTDVTTTALPPVTTASTRPPIASTTTPVPDLTTSTVPPAPTSSSRSAPAVRSEHTTTGNNFYFRTFLPTTQPYDYSTVAPVASTQHNYNHYSTLVSTTVDYTEPTTTNAPTAQFRSAANKNSALLQNIHSTTLPSVDKVYHKGYHIHPFGEQSPVLPVADHALPWKVVTANSDKQVQQQGFNGAWLANTDIDTQYNFINIKEFCQAAGKGLHAHPLHCWQFAVCGLAYGGDTEGYCHPGRRFDATFEGCIEDKTCIYGARMVKVNRLH